MQASVSRIASRSYKTIEFWKEADILSKLYHTNVVALYVVQDGSGATLATVTEYMVDGSLRQACKDEVKEEKESLKGSAKLGSVCFHKPEEKSLDIPPDTLDKRLQNYLLNGPSPAADQHFKPDIYVYVGEDFTHRARLGGGARRYVDGTEGLGQGSGNICCASHLESGEVYGGSGDISKDRLVRVTFIVGDGQSRVDRYQEHQQQQHSAGMNADKKFERQIDEGIWFMR
ncbi:hypothetical protein CTI12_AA133300 [Artemisia annua]|uniref:Serine-threonine/tyrosine-protein kinase catalytic domain-containing protein n=1 Tax=Artemisia annua TaxID=35608 RepID=A0A2U1PL39_ARTAN|nr:hypothetical protein CTI12_AA133300 [Artemisia annua]